MNNYTPILDKVISIKINSPLILLDYIKHKAQKSEGWHSLFGGGSPEKKFSKLEIDPHDPKDFDSAYIAGLAYSLLLQIYTHGGYKYFDPYMYYCGISIKNKHKIGFPHTDHTLEGDSLKDYPVLKILGILDIDWKPEWGGGFVWNQKPYSMSPNEFLIFDPKILHSGDRINNNKNRVTIDFTVPFKK